MKRLLFLIIAIPSLVNAQKIDQDKIDEFTKHHVKRTTWEALSRSNDFWAHARMSKIDSVFYLDLKFFRSGGEVLGISSGQKIMLKLDDDSILTFTIIGDKVSCRGCGAVGINGAGVMGLNISCIIPENEYNQLLHRKVVKIRLNTIDGYHEYKIKEKFQSLLSQELALM
jgi:hypothetical protein